MPKTRTKFVCQQCESQYPTSYGRCPNCGAWNSMVETVEAVASAPAAPMARPRTAPQALAAVDIATWGRLSTGGAEFDRVLGGGLVPGSLVLLGGDPGIGKSTLLAQVCIAMAGTVGSRQNAVGSSRSKTAEKAPRVGAEGVDNSAAQAASSAYCLLPTAYSQVLYVTGEESSEQVKLRADRLGAIPAGLFVMPEVDLGTIMTTIETMMPALAVIDSIQTMVLDDLSSSAGSVSQVRECAARLMHLAKRTHVPIVIVGHVTKEGTIAGPRVLEHIVDTVLYLEGERFHAYRLLRAVKNRFGSTNEVGVFEMGEDGLREVPNPSAAFLSERGEAAPGSAVTVTVEGTRPLLVEIQALVSQSSFTMPRRTSTGFDLNRLYLLLAVLQKRVGLPLGNQDVYCNVVGGLKIGEPAADLAVALATVSAFSDVAIPADVAAFGEVGLAGELRSVSAARTRLNEAAKLGFSRVLLPASSARALRKDAPVELLGAATLAEAIRHALPR
jgi:DNA repair protein RadA/Sms